MDRTARTKSKDGNGESGQAMVEAALTLPLVIFLILGTLQLFMLLQARIVAQHAAYRAARAGSLNHASCLPMYHQALLTVLPTFAPTDTRANLVSSFDRRKNNVLHAEVGGDGGRIIEIERHLLGRAQRADEEWRFDDFSLNANALTVPRLQVRMVFWYPMRIPFANWVMSRMFLAHFGLEQYSAVNPLMVTRDADWQADGDAGNLQSTWTASQLGARMRNASLNGSYLFPVRVQFEMRMLTPVRSAFFPPNTRVAACGAI